MPYRNQFPILRKKINGKQLVYLDAACTYLKHEDTIRGIDRYYKEFSCCAGDRESSYLGAHLLREIEETRKIGREFFGGKISDHIVFIASTTDGINRLIASLDFSVIRNIIVTDLEHNSNYLPQQEIAKRMGINFIVVPYNEIQNVSLLQKRLGSIGSSFLFCVTHSSNVLGGIIDIKSIADVVHSAGGYILVDDAQYIVHHEENVQENNIDFTLFSGHKIGGPTGIGLLYIKSGLEKLFCTSLRLGGGTVQHFDNDTILFKKLPDFFEGGVQDFGGILGLKSAIQWHMKHLIRQKNHIHKLVTYFLSKLDNALYSSIHILNKDNINNTTILSLTSEKIHMIDFHQYCNHFLNKYIIAFRTGSMCVDRFVNTYVKTKNIMRISFGIYNTKEDIDIFFEALSSFLQTTNIANDGKK